MGGRYDLPVSLREAWNRVGRADRWVWGGAIVLIALSFLPRIDGLRRLLAPVPTYNPPLSSGIRFVSSYVVLDRFWDLSGDVLIASAVALVVAWELARATDRAIRSSRVEVLGFVTALPVAVPLAWLAGCLAERASTNAGDHPLFQQVIPASIGAGAVVYLLVTALIVLAVKDRRRELTSGDPPREPPRTPAS